MTDKNHCVKNEQSILLEQYKIIIDWLVGLLSTFYTKKALLYWGAFLLIEILEMLNFVKILLCYT